MHELSAPQKQFARLQRDWLDSSGSRAKSHYVLFKPLNKYLHILAAGQGEPLLMLHGGNSFAALWEPLLNLLKNDFQLYAPDRFSCGLSDVVDYKTLDLYQHALDYLDFMFDHYQLSKVNIIGNSLGGYWAMLYALAKPERVNKIILIGAPGGTQAPPLLLRLFSVPVINQIISYCVTRGPDSTKNLLKRALVSDITHLPPQIFELMHVGLNLPHAQQTWLDILEMTCTIINIKPEFWMLDKISALQQKVLLLWGEKDVFGSIDQANVIAKTIPHAQLEIIKHSAHMPWLEQGDECARLIKNFL